MEAAGKAWKAIKTSGAKTWNEWIEVVGPGLVKARAEAQSVSNASSGKGYNTTMGALLQEYGFGDALERHRSQVTRADLLHCMDYLTEIESGVRMVAPAPCWRSSAVASTATRIIPRSTTRPWCGVSSRPRRMASERSRNAVARSPRRPSRRP